MSDIMTQIESLFKRRAVASLHHHLIIAPEEALDNNTLCRSQWTVVSGPDDPFSSELIFGR